MRRLTASFLALVLLAFCAGGASAAGEDGGRYIIRKIALAHCKRGPARCEKCRSLDVRKYCLLDIAPKGEMQRRIIEVVRNGRKEMREFDVVKVFASLPEAQAYAAAQGVTDAVWEADDAANASIDDDEALKEIASSLPAGWRLAIDENRLLAERKEAVWILFENTINAPLSRESDEERAARIIKEGHKTVCGLVFSLEPRWSDEKLRAARRRNEAIMEKCGKLPVTMGVASLYDSALSRKGEPVYTARTEEERALVAAYQKQRSELLKELVTLPDYHTRWYSLTLLSREGASDEMHAVHPPQASRELAEVERLFRLHASRK